ncbi:DNA polymerase III subunit beta [Desulfofundulus sp.]|uniref:DNA polymerase III subunit beta n=1 Tax=Desulfofundulus sp. TaxID=2282750 RepID=UPI003C78EF70
MKFTVSKETLESALFAAHRAVKPNSPLGVLRGVHMVIRGDRLEVVGTDAELTIRYTAGVEVASEGEVTVNAGIYDLVKRLPDGPVEVELAEGGLLLRYGGSEARVSVYEGEFPLLPAVSGGVGIEVSAGEFLNAVNRVYFACYKGMCSPILTGVLFRVTPFNLELVASDGVRINWACLPVSGGGGAEAVVPQAALQEALKVLGGDRVAVNVQDNLVVFRSGPVEVFSRTIAGRYPDYMSCVPEGFSARVRVSVRDLLETLGRAAVIVDSRNVSKVRVDVSGGKMTVSASGVGGSVTETLEVCHEGEPVTMFFQTRYLAEAVRVVGEEEAEVGFVTDAPAVKVASGDGTYFSVLRPLVREAAEAAA